MLKVLPNQNKHRQTMSQLFGANFPYVKFPKIPGTWAPHWSRSLAAAPLSKKIETYYSCWWRVQWKEKTRGNSCLTQFYHPRTGFIPQIGQRWSKDVPPVKFKGSLAENGSFQDCNFKFGESLAEQLRFQLSLGERQMDGWMDGWIDR